MRNNEVAKVLRAAAAKVLEARPSTAKYVVTIEASVPLHDKLVAAAKAALGDSAIAQRLLRVHDVTPQLLWSNKEKASLILSAAKSRMQKADAPGRVMSSRDKRQLSDFIDALDALVTNFHGTQTVQMLRHDMPVIGHRADDIVHAFDVLAEAVSNAMANATPDMASFAVDIKQRG